MICDLQQILSVIWLWYSAQTVYAKLKILTLMLLELYTQEYELLILHITVTS